MVTPLQLARVYATIDSYGIYRPLSITKVDPSVPGECIFSESTARAVVHMMEGVALPGDDGVEAVTKGYRITTKTSTMEKVGPDGRYINKCIVYTAGVVPVSQPRFVLVVVINNPQADRCHGGVVPMPVFGVIMGGILYIMNIEPDILTAGGKNEFVVNQGEDTGGRS